jgi:N-acetylglucosamine-6-phosphate deacetylase
VGCVLLNQQKTPTLNRKVRHPGDAGSASSQGKNAEEIVALTKRGLTPIEAIRAATTTASELMGRQDNVGILEAGKFADLNRRGRRSVDRHFDAAKREICDEGRPCG